MKDHLIIAIDGPAGSGKSTIARRIAENLNLLYIDTGAMYRAVTYAALLYKIDVQDESAVNHLLNKINLLLRKSPEGSIEILLDNHLLQKELRNIDVDKNVSLISSYRKVREYMVQQQRQLSKDYDVVLDGRDIGTVVFPEARYKFYLDATVEERAKRRFHDIKSEKGLTLEEIKQDLMRRDQLDKNREISPLCQAKDAIYVDTTSMSIDQVVRFLTDRMRELT